MARTYVRLLVLGCAAIGCAGGVPKPDFVTPFDKASPREIQDYLGKLEFDHRDGVGDDQILLLGCPDACRSGPRVAVYPERRSHGNSEKNLATGPGRIVATIINKDSTDYAPLNLRAGDTLYWAVDSVHSTGERLSRGRSLYISARALREGRGPAVVARRPLVIEKHPDQKPLGISLARWVFDSAGYGDVETPGGHSSLDMQMWVMATWGNCVKIGCCR
ncbi:MAG TPA: hypothetical protein VFB61_16940 [Gemmatimonadales bacterium]|nr:hypothetical protein [Gemmatimonadales bacterium]